MDSSVGTGLMAVFAVSGSIAVLAFQVHKRLLSDFMEKIEFELGSEKDQRKKKVRFADDVQAAKSPESGERRKKRLPMGRNTSAGDLSKKTVDGQKFKTTMPLNWQVMYKGIIQYKRSSNCI